MRSALLVNVGFVRNTTKNINTFSIIIFLNVQFAVSVFRTVHVRVSSKTFVQSNFHSRCPIKQIADHNLQTLKEHKLLSRKIVLKRSILSNEQIHYTENNYKRKIRDNQRHFIRTVNHTNSKNRLYFE